MLKMSQLSLVLLLSALCCIGVVSVSGESHDFGDVNSNIDWKTLGDIRSPDFNWADNKKPVMYLFTQPWCVACNRLKETMTAEGDGKSRMEMFSKHYLMVHVGGSENDDLEEQFTPNGQAYIPRVLFATPDGKVNPDLLNVNNGQYPYFYTSAPAVANAMEDFLPFFYPDMKKKKKASTGKKCPFVKNQDDDEEEDDGDEYEDVEDDEAAANEEL